MRIIRYLDNKGNERYGAQQKDGLVIELTGDLFSDSVLETRAQQVEVRRVLVDGECTLDGGKGVRETVLREEDRRHAEEAAGISCSFR